MIFPALPLPRLASLMLTLALLLAAFGAWAEPSIQAARQYNEACRLSLAGDLTGALAAFQEAMAEGFDDLDFARNDPDLAALRREKGYQDLITARQSLLQLRSSELGLTLVSGQWTESVELESGNDSLAGSPSPMMRLRWLPTGLEFELTLREVWSQLTGEKLSAPWNGGPGLILTLGLPEEPFSTRSHFLFAFGLEKSSPVGGLYLERGGWQRILELDPRIQIEDGGETTVLRCTIPWQSIQPFHPLVDPRLGFNAAVRIPHAGGYNKAELLPDPRAFLPKKPGRRIVPLKFSIETETRESLVGKVDQSISAGGPQELTLTAISSQDGPGTLTIDFTDNQQKSLLPDGAISRRVNLSTGPNSLQDQADFSNLKPGLYVVRTELVFPSGRSAVWSTRVLQLGADWQADFAAQLEKLPPSERPTGQFYLRQVESALNDLRPRFNPGPIATTLNDLERILARAQVTGTILPDFGTMLLVYAGPGGQDRLATIYLPEDYRQRGPVNPVLVSAAAPGLEASLMQRLARSYQDPDHLDPGRRTTPVSPIFIIPHFESYQRDIQDQSLAELTAALDWTLEFFQAEKASLCGVDFCGAPALRLASRQPEKIRSLQIMAGGRLDPWPQATREFMASQLEPTPAGVPVTWLDFNQETEFNGQGALILDVLQQLGYSLEPVQKVRGGLSVSQVADRVVLWAESIP